MWAGQARCFNLKLLGGCPGAVVTLVVMLNRDEGFLVSSLTKPKLEEVYN